MLNKKNKQDNYKTMCVQRQWYKRKVWQQVCPMQGQGKGSCLGQSLHVGVKGSLLWGGDIWDETWMEWHVSIWGKAFQAEGGASAKTLRQEQSWHVPEPARRVWWEGGGASQDKVKDRASNQPSRDLLGQREEGIWLKRQWKAIGGWDLWF